MERSNIMTTDERIAQVRLAYITESAQFPVMVEDVPALVNELESLRARVQRLMAVVRQCPCIGRRDYTTCSGRRASIDQMCPRCAALAEGGTRRKAIEALAAEAQALGLYDAEGEDR